MPSHFRFAERQPETELFATWFDAQGYEVTRLPEDLDHEGAGDALPFGGGLLSGYRFRSDLPATTELSRLTGAPVRAIELVDERLYHIDITFCPLDERRAICAPMGWDAYGRKVVEALVPEPLWLEDEEALGFCANSVVVGSTVVMPATPVRVGRQLEAWGFDVVSCDVERVPEGGRRVPLPHTRARRGAADLRSTRVQTDRPIATPARTRVHDHEGGRMVVGEDQRVAHRPVADRPDGQDGGRVRPRPAPHEHHHRGHREAHEHQHRHAGSELRGGRLLLVAPQQRHPADPGEQGPRDEGGGGAGPESGHDLEGRVSPPKGAR